MRSLLDVFRRLTMIPQGLTIVTTAFLPTFAIVSMFPAVPSIIDHFAADPDARWKVPLMVSAPGATIALFAPFAGFFVDRFGRRPLLMGATLLYALFGCAPFFLDDLNAVFASRLLLGIAEAGILTIVNTLIGDYWDDRGRRDWLLIQGLAGPALAAVLILVAGAASTARWNGIFLVYAIALPIFVAMLLFLFEPTREGATAAEITAEAAPTSVAKTPFPWATVALLGGVTLISSILYFVFIINGGLAFREVGVQDPGRLSQLTAIPSLFVVLGAIIFRLLGSRSNAVQIGAMFLLVGTGLTAIGLAPDYRWMIVGLVVQQTGVGMAVPVLIAWASSKLSFQHRGRGMGVWTACFFFGQFCSPWIVHRVNDATGTMQSAFVVMGVIGLAVALFALVGLRRGGAPLPAAA